MRKLNVLGQDWAAGSTGLHFTDRKKYTSPTFGRLTDYQCSLEKFLSLLARPILYFLSMFFVALGTFQPMWSTSKRPTSLWSRVDVRWSKLWMLFALSTNKDNADFSEYELSRPWDEQMMGIVIANSHGQAVKETPKHFVSYTREYFINMSGENFTGRATSRHSQRNRDMSRGPRTVVDI